MIHLTLGSVNVHAAGTNRRTNKDIVRAGRGRKRTCPWINKVCYLLVVDENRYELYLQKGRQLTVDMLYYYRASLARYSFPV